jgi:hypothetical protein
MQVLFAAPFILAAGIVFTVLSVIPRLRRWAIPIATGILGARPSSLPGLFVGALVFHTSEPVPTGHGWLVAFVCAGAFTGLVGGVVIGAIAQVVASFLPLALLRVAVLIAAWCSDFVLLAGHRSAAQTPKRLETPKRCTRKHQSDAQTPERLETPKRCSRKHQSTVPGNTKALHKHRSAWKHRIRRATSLHCRRGQVHPTARSKLFGRPILNSNRSRHRLERNGLQIWSPFWGPRVSANPFVRLRTESLRSLTPDQSAR